MAGFESCRVQEEARLAQAAKEGSGEAFARLYELYFERVYRYVLVRVGNPAQAEDLAGDVFIRAFEALKSYAWRGVPFSAWLFRIAHNRVVDHHRKEAGREPVYLDGPVSFEGDDPHDAVVLKMNIEAALGALEELTNSQRQVIALRFASGLSIAETAKAMGKNEGAIKALQHSAIRALRRVLERRGTLEKVKASDEP